MVIRCPPPPLPPSRGHLILHTQSTTPAFMTPSKQVLVQMGQVTQRALHKQEKEAREAGKASFFLAWVSQVMSDLMPPPGAGRGLS